MHSLLFAILLGTVGHTEVGYFVIKNMQEKDLSTLEEKVCNQGGFGDCKVELGKITIKSNGPTGINTDQVRELVKNSGQYRVFSSEVIRKVE